MTRSPYKKLAGRGLTWGGPSRVWLGEDHVLLVLTRGYVEAYRRFFFKDIQGFVVRQTQIGKIWNAVWAACVAFFGFLALALNDVGTIIMLCLAAPFAVGLLINVLLGPTCSFHIRTAVQTERLPAVSRVRSAQNFIEGIEPLITAAQGEIAGDQFNAELERLQNSAGYPAAAPPVMGS
jgi:hypothetical protein